MSADSVRKLLNLPDDVRQPHAYQIFGLSEGEQDTTVIRSAIEAVIGRLRGIRPSTDPNAWNQTAQIVQQARLVLADPQKKAELDARFGIVTIEGDDGFDDFGDDDFDATESSSSAATTDPLAGLLPDANPLAPASPLTAISPVVPSVPDASSASVVVPTLSESASQAIVPPRFRTNTPVTRRRRSVLPMLLFSIVAVGLTLSVVGLTYYLVFGPGSLAIQTGDGSLKISTGPTQNDGGTQVSPPQSTASDSARSRVDRDPVMGTLAPQLSHTKPPSESLEPAIQTPGITTPGITMPGTTTPGPTMSATMDPPTPAVEPAASETSMSDTMMSPSAPDEKRVKAANEAIAQAQAAIRTADWMAMKSLAEKAVATAVTDEQRSAADGVFQLADLANFYRGGIVRAIEGLAIGNSFDVTEGLSVIVVETGADKLVIRYNAKSVSYTLNELPLVLAHRLASFQVPQDAATSEAAKAAYQAITPVSTPPYREQSIQWLQQIDTPIEGADRDKLIASIRSVYGE